MKKIKKTAAQKKADKAQSNNLSTAARRERDHALLALFNIGSTEGLLGKMHRMDAGQIARLRDVFAEVT